MADFDAALEGSRPALDRLAVYADGLVGAGHAQGELINLHLSSESDAARLTEFELTSRIQRSFGLANRDLQALSFEWRLGFVETLTVKTPQRHMATAVSRLMAAPACRFVRRIRLQTSEDASWFVDVVGLEQLERLTGLACSNTMTQFEKVSRRLPMLTHLSLDGSGLPQKALRLPQLRSLEVRRAHRLARLFEDPPWRFLEHLSLSGVDVPLGPVLEANPLRTLVVFGGPQTLASLVATEATRKLEKLTLRGFHDLGPLLEHRKRLEGLRLHIESGTCRPEQLGALRATLKLTWAGVYEPEREEENFQRKIR